MEADSIHSAIETVKSVVSVHVPDDWFNIMRLKHQKQHYNIFNLVPENFINFKSPSKKHLT